MISILPLSYRTLLLPPKAVSSFIHC
jgi:hypothetical protein